MSSLYLVRAPIRIKELVRWAGERGWARAGSTLTGFDSGRALHHLLTEVFGPRVLKPYRLMAPRGVQEGNLYAYTCQDENGLRQAAATFAWPDHLWVLDADRITTKSMRTDWRESQRLGFDLLARPIRRVSAPINTRDGRVVGHKSGTGTTELDAFLLAGLRNPDAVIYRQDIYFDWLEKQLGAAATLDRTASRLARFQRVRAARGDKAIEGPDAVFHGVLTVTDSVAFTKLLKGGIGRHRAYGYGMLLLRPPRQAALQR